MHAAAGVIKMLRVYYGTNIVMRFADQFYVLNSSRFMCVWWFVSAKHVDAPKKNKKTSTTRRHNPGTNSKKQKHYEMEWFLFKSKRHNSKFSLWSEGQLKQFSSGLLFKGGPLLTFNPFCSRCAVSWPTLRSDPGFLAN